MSTPLIIGHRGASAVAPENTMIAFQLALEAGADGIEFDVRLTRDGVPVVIHDEDLRRTGNKPDQVAALTLEELKRIDVASWFTRKHGIDYSRQTVPTLKEVFELFENFSETFLLYLEMKSDKAQRTELARSCCEALRRTSVRNQVIVESFDLTAIEIVKEIDPEIKTAALFDPSLRHPPALSSGLKLVERALAVRADEIALHHRLATERTIESAKQADLNVVVWTVDDPSWIGRARLNNIKALITNDPELMVQARLSSD
jgi:glycerophosphoryl diester phosphodiesterase